MHVKYASRHVLYPVPYAPVIARVLIAARAGRISLWSVVLMDVRCACGAMALRADVMGVVAVRALVTVCCTRLLVAVRAFVRGVTDVRDVVRVATRASDVLRTDVVFDALRVMEFASRTAASAVPILMKNAMIKYNAFLIRSTINIMLSKKGIADKGYCLDILIKKCPIGHSFIGLHLRRRGGCVQQMLCDLCPNRMVSFQHVRVRQH